MVRVLTSAKPIPFGDACLSIFTTPPPQVSSADGQGATGSSQAAKASSSKPKSRKRPAAAEGEEWIDPLKKPKARKCPAAAEGDEWTDPLNKPKSRRRPAAAESEEWTDPLNIGAEEGTDPDGKRKKPKKLYEPGYRTVSYRS
jgi:hypothetical protein